jgi:2'-5' RNA ligase
VTRLFVAIDLPLELRERLAALSRSVPGARGTKAGQLHLTLRFAGELDEEGASALRAGLAGVAAAAAGSFELTVRGVGAFPRRRDPRVVWAGLAPSEELDALHGLVEKAAVAAGLEPERKRFRPHLTLARLRRADTRAVGAWLDEHAGLEEPPFAVEELTLFSSELRPSGAVHRVLAAWRLGDGP